jgi:hypothetical protein
MQLVPRRPPIPSGIVFTKDRTIAEWRKRAECDDANHHVGACRCSNLPAVQGLRTVTP